ncbi:HNH endonuclease family protein [Gordonia alkaliphila]|uniref:HNH endonuclease family protein n=1 Tax=Gordonia alkaliphila TaxID=1053547 RepID=UPI001FF67B96|nr:HNH endonuclease family protein [Gordonia alkaliphila]MCK0441148.1 HNH endonuclease family protein [Gordonia alkaliphila]
MVAESDVEQITQALDLLPTLLVRPAEDTGDFDRTAHFGPRWTDNHSARLGHNGCRTDADIIREQILDSTYADECSVAAGTVNDLYTGTTYPYDRQSIQIDHVVSLSQAWKTGARYLSQSQRVAFANDPDNLLVAGASANMSKGNKSFDQWRPDNSAFVCVYGARQIRVKAKYQLWVTPTEQSTLQSFLSACIDATSSASSFR